MRRIVVLVALLVAGCISRATVTEPDARAGTYALTSIDLDSLPMQPDYSSGSRWVLAGSLTLEADGSFLLSERDSVWNGRAFARQDHSEAGRWSSDGSLLMLSDTAGGATDPYGSATAMYVGSISASVVLLTIQADDDTESHIYRYKR